MHKTGRHIKTNQDALLYDAGCKLQSCSTSSRHNLKTSANKIKGYHQLTKQVQPFKMQSNQCGEKTKSMEKMGSEFKGTAAVSK